MDKLIVFNISFNTHKYSPMRLTPEWISYRMKIFMNYTCKSLINQSNQSFFAIISYDKESENLVLEELAKYPILPKNISFTTSYRKDINSMLPNYDYFYEVRLDCDDMFHPSFVNQLVNINPKKETKAIINQNGFVYDIELNRLGKWYCVSPPFYTLVYPAKEFLNGSCPKYTTEGGHIGAIKLPHEILPNDNYMVIIHGKNTLNKFNSRNQVMVIDNDSLKQSILNEFNL